MKKIGILIIIISISFSAIAQKSYKVMQKNVFSAMDSRLQSEIDEELTDARVDFKKILSKNKEDAMAVFGLSVIYGYDKYSKKDYFESWKYFQEAEKMQAKFTEDDKTVLDEYFFKVDKKRRYKPIDKNMQWERGNVEDKLIKFVREENNSEIANRFIDEFPESKYYENVIHIRNYIEFRIAENTNSVEAYNNFLAKYPDAAQTDIAKRNRNKIAYDKAVASNNLSALKSFVAEYPHAEQVEEAKKLMGVFAFNQAVQENTLEAIEKFMQSYPNSSKMPEARNIQRKLMFDWAKQVNTIEAYNKFVSQYPEGEMYIDIFNLKSKALGEQIQTNFPFENYAFVRGFDNNKVSDFGGDVAKRSNGDILLVGNTKKETSGPYDIWILGLDANGKMKWNSIIGNKFNDNVKEVKVNTKNEIFAAGSTNSKDNMQGRSWIFKLNPEGKNIYNQILDGTEIHNLQLYNDGKALVCGKKINGIDSTEQTYIMKVNEKGRKLWDRTYSQNGYLGGTAINSENTAFVAGDNWIFALDDMGYLKWDKIMDDESIHINSVCLTNNLVIFSGIKGHDLFSTAYDFAGNYKWETTFERVNGANVNKTITLSDNSILVCSETLDKQLVISKLDAAGVFINSKTFHLSGGITLNGIDAVENASALVSITPLNKKDLILFKLKF